MFKKEKFSTSFFVSASILALFFLLAFYLLLNLLFAGVLFQFGSARDNQIDRVFLRDDNQNNDPYITKNSNLRDILAGPIITQKDPFIGNTQAPVMLVIFSDFECDICHQQAIIMKKVMEKYGDKVRFVWKDYPDRNQKPISFLASLAGRCANEQGKFWEYNDLLFANNDNLNNDKFIELANTIDLNKEKFADCLKTSKFRQDIMDNITEANALDIVGVPFVYVNDQEVMGEISYEDLVALIEKELNNK